MGSNEFPMMGEHMDSAVTWASKGGKCHQMNLLHVTTFVCSRWWATVFTTRSFEDMVLPVDGSARN